MVPFAAGAQEAPGPQSSGAQPGTAETYQKLEKFLEFIRARNREQFAIRAKNGIDEASYVPIGGIDQWLTVRGEDRSNPVLLIVHGGPGDTTNPWTFEIFAPWERYFTVVQWDERGAGMTFKKNGESLASTMTRERLVQDGIEVADYLRKHLQKEKIVVVGHSFGSILALRMVTLRPELFYAYVGTGQVSDTPVHNYAADYDALLKKAQATGNQQALEELRNVGPPPYKSGAGYRVLWKWANRFEGADQFLMGTIGLSLVAPRGSAENLVAHEEGEMFSGEHLVDYDFPRERKDLGLKFAVPIFVVQGAEDFTTSTALAQEYVAAIEAPHKEFVTIQDGGHFAIFMKPDLFLDVLVKHVRPLAH